MGLLFNNATLLTPEHVDYANSLILRLSAVEPINITKLQDTKIVFQMDKEMNELAEKLENIYKSVADVTPKH